MGRQKDETQDIDPALVLKCIQGRLADKGRDEVFKQMQQLQAALYIMCGGGFLGRSLAESPADNYVDDRCSIPFSRKAVYNVMQVLTIYAGVLKLDPTKLPGGYFDCHNCGVW